MKTSKIVTQLALLIALLAVIASGAGIFWQGEGDAYEFTSLRGETVTIYGHGLYRYDSVSYAAQAISQDVVTLLIGIPLLVVGICLARKGSLRGQLLLTGTLGNAVHVHILHVPLSV